MTAPLLPCSANCETTVSVSFLSSEGLLLLGIQSPCDLGSLMGMRKVVTMLTVWFVYCRVGEQHSLSAFCLGSRHQSWTRLPWGLSGHPPAPKPSVGQWGCILGLSSFLSLTLKGPSM